MKVGMNMLLWTTDVQEEHYPLMAELKAGGFDGVEMMLNTVTQANNFSPPGVISSKIAGKRFWLLVDDSTGDLIWECTCKRRQHHDCGANGEILEKYLPSTCTNIGRP